MTDGAALAPITPHDAVFLDFDGTLAPIADDPAGVEMPGEVARALETLSRRLDGAVAVVSGRALADLIARTPESIWRAGGHGLHVCAPGETQLPPLELVPADTLARLEAFADKAPGVWVENKGAMAAVHYRAAPARAGDVARAVEAEADALEDYVAQHGKMVVELKPKAANKGAAVARLLAAPPFAGRRAVMVGDDVTDEDAFAAVNAAGGLTVKVGPGPTIAKARVDALDAVHQWLIAGASL